MHVLVLQHNCQCFCEQSLVEAIRQVNSQVQGFVVMLHRTELLAPCGFPSIMPGRLANKMVLHRGLQFEMIVVM